jgi:hypothetical protein
VLAAFEKPAKGRVLNYFEKCGAVCAIAVMSQGCAASPKMSADAPLEARPGNWVGWTQFYQHGRRIDRGDAKDNLKRVEESAGDTKTAEALEVGAVITSVGAGILLGTGASQALNGQKSWPLFVAGGASLGLSIGFALGADGKYAGAVNSYNRQLGPSNSRLNEP